MGIFTKHFTKDNFWWRTPSNGREYIEKTDEILTDPLAKLRIDLDNSPSDSADANILISVSKDEYNKNKDMLDTMYLTAAELKTNVLSAVEQMTETDYQQIMTILNNLTSVTKGKKTFDYKMDKKIDVTRYMNKTQKYQFLGSTTDAVFNMLQIIKYHAPEEPLDMPDSISKSIDNSLKRSKDEILIDQFGGLDYSKKVKDGNIFYTYNFTASADAWVGVYTTITPSATYNGDQVIHCIPTYDGYSYINSPVISISGSANSMIKIRFKKLSDTNAPWFGGIYYTTPFHTWSDSYRLLVPEPQYDEDGWGIIECDMSRLTYGGPYGTDWMENVITGIRFDFFRGTFSTFQDYIVDWVKISDPSDFKVDDNSLYTKFIHPLLEYQEYLDSNGIKGMIDKLTNTELFLIPQYCDPENFLAGNILFSQYYSNLFMIDSIGNIWLNKIADSPELISKFHNIVENLTIYYENQ